MKAKKKYSIKSRIIGMIMLCWCVPVILTLVVIGYYVFGDSLENKMTTQMRQLMADDQVSVERLNSLVKTARKVTYDGNIESAFSQYKNKKINQGSLLEISSSYLRIAFEQNVKVKGVLLWFYENPQKLQCEMMNKEIGGNYREVNQYWEEDHEKIAEYAKTLDTRIGFYEKDGRFYLVRNLMDHSYTPMAVLVIRVNQDYCFDKGSEYPLDSDITVQLGDCKFPVRGKEIKTDKIGLRKGIPATGYVWGKGRLFFAQQIEGEGYWLRVYLRISDISSFMPFYGYKFVIIGMLVLTIPFLYICLRMFSKYMTNPMKAMTRGAKEVERGDFGYQIEEESESVEFEYLIETFNGMSRKIKEQFIQIYNEEVALKDAQIKALQSHINPHFLNNTLEIINWEARMAGNEKVSQMIEALSILMDATMDRKKRPEVLLAEEMHYVKAYLYIASRRLGSRLEVIDELPQEIMQYEVPRLILQPIIENAIEHGAAKHKHGIVKLNGYKEGKYLYIEIRNDSELSGEEKEKIARLLGTNTDVSKETSGNIGISNVNQRLRILYGEPCGLTISMDEKKWVVSRLTILVEKTTI